MQGVALRLTLGFTGAAVLALGALLLLPDEDGGDRPPESTLVLAGEGAPTAERALGLLVVATAFGAGFLALAHRPQEVVLGYKG